MSGENPVRQIDVNLRRFSPKRPQNWHRMDRAHSQNHGFPTNIACNSAEYHFLDDKRQTFSGRGVCWVDWKVYGRSHWCFQSIREKRFHQWGCFCTRWGLPRLLVQDHTSVLSTKDWHEGRPSSRHEIFSYVTFSCPMCDSYASFCTLPLWNPTPHHNAFGPLHPSLYLHISLFFSLPWNFTIQNVQAYWRQLWH